MRKNSFSFSSVANKSASIILMLGCIWALPVRAEPVPPADLTSLRELKVQESRKNETGNQFQIGDRIPLYVSIPADLAVSGDTLELKAPDKGSKLEDQGWFLDDAHQFENGNFRFIVSPIQTGALTLPTLVIFKNGEQAIARTSPYSIQVRGPEMKNQKPPELLGIMETSLPTKYVVFFVIVALMVAALAIYLIRRFRKKASHQKTPPPVPAIEPAHRVALKKIELVYERYPFSVDHLKPVAFELSEIIKEFFSARFKIDALESTTAEMIALLKREAVSEESIREINALFSVLDLVKFTRRENYEHFDLTRYQELKIRSQAIIHKWALEAAT